MSKERVFGGIAVIGLVLLAGWTLGWFGGHDRQVTALREQMENREQLSDAERQAIGEQIRSLSDAQRSQLFEPMMQARFNGMRDRVHQLMAMPEPQRRAELDQWIDEMENRRREWQARGDRGDRGGPPGGGPGGRNMTEAQRDQRRKGMLDRTTPEMRATMDQMMDMVNKRRAERGMDPLSSPRGLFAGGRRG